MQHPSKKSSSDATGLAPSDIGEMKRIVTLLEKQQSANLRPAIVIEDDRERLRAAARRTHEERALRKKFFPTHLIGEAPWDMLLVLYYDENRRKLTVTSLSVSAEVAPTTGLRWLEAFHRDEFIALLTSPTDQRLKIVTLTDKGRTALDQYFSYVLLLN